jgi:GntR family transcriptional regulator/MocR family aminotransferase
LELERTTSALLRANVKVHSLKRYYLGPETSEGLIFGYGAVGLADIERGFAVLRAALK